MAAAWTACAAPSLYEQQLQQGWPSGRAPLGVGFEFGHVGAVVTAAHVVAGCHHVWRLHTGGARTQLHIVGIDAASDLALLQGDSPPGDNLAPAAAGVLNGERVLALLPGEPPRRMTVLGPADPGQILLSPALDLGHSGSPVVTPDGNLVGVASAIDDRHTIVISAATVVRFTEYYGIHVHQRSRLKALPGRLLGAEGHILLPMDAVFNVTCT